MGGRTRPLAAAVLAGGRSRRMGRDKALLTVGGTTMVERVVAACRTAGADRVAVVGHRHPSTLPGGLDAELVADLHPGEGPLGGIDTALDWAPAPVVLVVACDLPFVDADVLRSLAGATYARPVDAAVALSARGLEPLVAAWRAAAQPAVREAIERGQRAVRAALDGFDVALVEVADEVALTNVNRPDQLRAARGESGGPSRPG